MIGIRNNCELVHAYLGGNAGVFAGFLLLFGLTAPWGSADSVKLALMTGLFSIMFVTFQFTVLYGRQFWRFLTSILLAGFLYGFIIYYLALLVATKIMQPFLMAVIGVFVGIVLGRLLCASCFEGDRLTRALKK